MDLTEEELRLGEDMEIPVREKILASGDQQLVRILRILPEEASRDSWVIGALLDSGIRDDTRSQ